MTIGESTIGTSRAGSIRRLPGRSVRTTRKASTPPSGTAIAVMPAASASVIMSLLRARGFLPFADHRQALARRERGEQAHVRRDRLEPGAQLLAQRGRGVRPGGWGGGGGAEKESGQRGRRSGGGAVRAQGDGCRRDQHENGRGEGRHTG